MVALSPAYLATLEQQRRLRRQQDLLRAWLQGAQASGALQALVSALGPQPAPGQGWSVLVALPGAAARAVPGRDYSDGGHRPERGGPRPTDN